jgi:hypothetical protein
LVGRPTQSNWDKVNGNLANHKYAYNGSALTVYWGNTNPISNPQSALELNLIVKNSSGGYDSKRFFLDGNVARTSGATTNNFTPVPGCGTNGPYNTSLSIDGGATDRFFNCQQSIAIAAGDTPILIRARILYSNGKEPIAVGPSGACATNCSLPPQAAVYTSKGFSGQSQKTLQVFRQPYYLPPLLDFVLFSAATIQK